MMSKFQFVNPEFLILFIVYIPLLFFWIKTKKKNYIPFKISSLKPFKNHSSNKSRWIPLLNVLRIIGISGIIIALARPQTSSEKINVNISDGIDIVLAIDVSSSMLAKDLKPNRLEALKNVAKSFAENRVNDRLGVVLYASEAYTKSPVTNDQYVIADALQSIKHNPIIKDGTAIGVGLGTAINRLKNSPAKSRIILLMTDGVNNSGLIDPMMAADIAKENKIKVYTIGIGSNGKAPMPVSVDLQGRFTYKNIDVKIDESLLKSIAKKTNGKYYRANNNQSLKEIYNEIDNLEKTKINETKYVKKTEWFRPFVLLALLLLVLEFVCRKTLFKGII